MSIKMRVIIFFWFQQYALIIKEKMESIKKDVWNQLCFQYSKIVYYNLMYVSITFLKEFYLHSLIYIWDYTKDIILYEYYFFI